MIVRKAQHDRDFVVLSRHTLEDPALSIKARGLLCFLLAKPDDWQVHVRQVAKACGCSKNTVVALLAELEAAGYCTKHQERGEAGQFTGHEIVVYEERQPRPAESEAPRPKKRDTAPRPKNWDRVPNPPPAVFLGHTKYPLGDQVYRELAALLEAAVRRTFPAQQFSLVSAERELRLLVTQDGAPEHQVRAVIAWLPTAPASRSGFSWAKAVTSGASFRKNFPRMADASGAPKKPPAPPRRCPACDAVLTFGSASFTVCACGRAWELRRGTLTAWSKDEEAAS